MEPYYTDEPLSAPFPYFGGKRRAAPAIWDALGDVGGYVEPFCGSAAVLLARPPFKGRRVETINDADGWLINAWRSIQLSPDDTARHAAGPVAEVDYHARLAWLQERRTPDLVSWLEGDPEHHDPKAAGWWLYVMACGIGDPWGPGPWRVIDGHLRDVRKLPHLGDAGKGVNRELPHLGNAGKGVNRELPHLGDAGKGVNRELPHLGNAGKGVNRELPHLGDAGKGVNRELPHLGDAGKGVNRELPHLGNAGRVTDYLNTLAARLHRTRITCGTWTRVLKPSVIRATANNPHIGVFLDPPYAIGGDLYATTNTGHDTTVPDQVRAWCAENGTRYRIILCGFDTDHDALLDRGWRKEVGRAGGGAGYNTNSKAGRRERLWLSPQCLAAHDYLDFGSGA